MPNDTLLNRSEFYRKMETLLNASANSLEGKRELKDLKNWDSLAILEFIVLADTDYKSDVQPTEIAECQTMDDLAQLVVAHSTLA